MKSITLEVKWTNILDFEPSKWGATNMSFVGKRPFKNEWQKFFEAKQERVGNFVVWLP